MADDLQRRTSPDRSSVTLDQERERRYWAHKFGVTEEELRRAVEAVGSKPSFVERCLRTSG